MVKYLYLLFFLFFITTSNANNTDSIINNLKNIENINFKFEQNVNKKIEKGNCIVQYPKKIFCEYTGTKDKI